MADDGIKPAGKGRWQVRVKRVEKRTGKVVNRKATVLGSRRDAIRVRDELRAAAASTSATRPRTRLSEFAASWLEQRAANLKPSVVSKYGYSLGHILPVLGDMYLDTLAPSDIAGYVVGRKAAGNTVLNELRLLRTMAKDAVVDGYSAKDWCARVKAPRVARYTRERPNSLTLAQAQHVLSLIPKHHYPLALFLITTGLRWGEAAGLRWSDYDETTGEIAVSRGNWKGTIVTPKTPGSYRSVPLLPEVAALITRHKKTDLLFHTRDGRLHRGYPLLRALAKACKAAGVPHTTVHGLRRSFNNHGRRVASGSVLRAITGHADEAMTDHYSTIDVGEKAAVARSVANAIGLKQAE